MTYSRARFKGRDLVFGSWAEDCGHTWLHCGHGKIYSLRSLPERSFLVVNNPDGTNVGEYPTIGRHSCHINLVNDKAIVSDYSSGTLSLFHLDGRGVPDSNARIILFTGLSHIHSSWLSPNDGKIIVADLGADCLYRFDDDNFNHYETFRMPPGSGPRHCAFNNNGNRLYVSTEKSDEVIVLDYPSMSVVDSVVVNTARPQGGAHLLLSGDGRFLYASSRLKNDGIAVCRVLHDGRLAVSEYINCGLHPRHFSISSDGAMMAVACRDSDKLEFYDIDTESGGLSLCGAIPCLKPVFCSFI